MKTSDRLRRHGFGAAGALLSLALLLAGCASKEPAPVVTGGQGPPPPAQITVQRGQTLSGIARAYHVPMFALAEANHLSPPYRILVGQALIIPVGAEPRASGSMVAIGEPVPTQSSAYGPSPTYSPASSRQPGCTIGTHASAVGSARQCTLRHIDETAFCNAANRIGSAGCGCIGERGCVASKSGWSGSKANRAIDAPWPCPYRQRT